MCLKNEFSRFELLFIQTPLLQIIFLHPPQKSVYSSVFRKGYDFDAVVDREIIQRGCNYNLFNTAFNRIQ